MSDLHASKPMFFKVEVDIWVDGAVVSRICERRRVLTRDSLAMLANQSSVRLMDYPDRYALHEDAVIELVIDTPEPLIRGHVTLRKQGGNIK